MGFAIWFDLNPILPFTCVHSLLVVTFFLKKKFRLVSFSVLQFWNLLQMEGFNDIPLQCGLNEIIISHIWYFPFTLYLTLLILLNLVCIFLPGNLLIGGSDICCAYKGNRGNFYNYLKKNPLENPNRKSKFGVRVIVFLFYFPFIVVCLLWH